MSRIFFYTSNNYLKGTDDENNVRKYIQDNVSEFSAQCSYYMILAFVPFLILLITLVQYTGIEPETIYEIVSEIVPTTMNEVVVGIIQEAYSKSLEQFLFQLYLHYGRQEKVFMH